MKVTQTPESVFHPVTITLESRSDVLAIKAAIAGMTLCYSQHRPSLKIDESLLELDKLLSKFLVDLSL